MHFATPLPHLTFKISSLKIITEFGLLCISACAPCLAPCNEHCTSLHHDLVSAIGFAAQESRQKFGSVTGMQVRLLGLLEWKTVETQGVDFFSPWIPTVCHGLNPLTFQKRNIGHPMPRSKEYLWCQWKQLTSHTAAHSNLRRVPFPFLLRFP